MATASLKVRIVNDQHSSSPREWDNLGTMVCAHGRYNLGDSDGVQVARDFVLSHFSYDACNARGWDLSHVPDIESAVEATGQAIMLPLYLYDHSGITMSTTRFSCPWDSGKVGFIFVPKEKVRSEYGYDRISKARQEKILSYLKGEVETYDQFLTGDVWGFVLSDGTGKTLDSCWGFYGDDPVTNGIIEHLPPEAIDLVKQGQYERAYA